MTEIEVEFRCWEEEESPAPGEIWIRPAARADFAAAISVSLAESGLMTLATGVGMIQRIVIQAAGEQPTFDEMLASHLARQLLASHQLLPFHFDLAKYAALLRQGMRPTALPLADSIEGIYLAIRNRAGADLTSLDVAKIFLDSWRRLIQHLDLRGRAGIDFFRETPFSDSEFSKERADLLADERRYRFDVARGERWLVHLPDTDTTGSGLFLKKPTSFLFQYWSRSDLATPTGEPYIFLAVEKEASNWVFSTDPALSISLQPLAKHLQEAESAQQRIAAPLKELDESQVWYDGQRHNYSIVGAPRDGTHLSKRAILRLVKRATRARRYVPVRSWLFVSLLGILLIGLTFLVWWTNQDRQSFPYPEVAPAVVLIKAGKERGTGFLVSPDGWLVTNHHVIHELRADSKRGGQRIAIVQLGKMVEGNCVPIDSLSTAVVMKDDPDRDLALLRLSRLPTDVRTSAQLQLADVHNEIPVGTTCWAIGNPVQFGDSFNMLVSGVVSRVEIPSNPVGRPRVPGLVRWIHSSCGVTPGYSGGPLLDQSGRVLGMTVGISGGGKDTLHVHVDELRDFIGDYLHQTYESPFYMPSELPQYRKHLLANLDGSGEQNVIAFYQHEIPENAELCGLWLDLKNANARNKQDELQDPQHDPVRNGAWRHQFAVTMDPWPTTFYDQDDDGQVDLILQCPIVESGEAFADQRWQLVDSGWKFDTPPAATPLLEGTYFPAGPLRDNFNEVVHILARRIRATR